MSKATAGHRISALNFGTSAKDSGGAEFPSEHEILRRKSRGLLAAGLRTRGHEHRSCRTGYRQINEPDQGQSGPPYMLWQPVPCCDDPLQINVKGCQGRTIKAAVLQRICITALRAIGHRTIASAVVAELRLGSIPTKLVSPSCLFPL